LIPQAYRLAGLAGGLARQKTGAGPPEIQVGGPLPAAPVRSRINDSERVGSY
jgi:hypothetical protein